MQFHRVLLESLKTRTKIQSDFPGNTGKGTKNAFWVINYDSCKTAHSLEEATSVYSVRKSSLETLV